MQKLYVGNWPFQATEQDLAAWLVQAGVSGPSVTLIRHQMSGQLRGFGFVEVPNNEVLPVERLNCAIRLLVGRNVVVNEATPRGRGGGRGGFGGGRGRNEGGGFEEVTAVIGFLDWSDPNATESAMSGIDGE